MVGSGFEKSYFEEGPYGKQGVEIIERNYKMLLDYARAVNFLPNNPKLILDFGCAFGIGTVYLSKQYPRAHVVGVDISKYAINKAKLNYNRENVDYYCLDLTHTNSVDFLRGEYGGFGLIFTRDTLEHMPRSRQDKVLLAFRKLLNENGVVIAQTPNRLNLLSYADKTHIGLRSPKSWKNLFQKFFKEVKVLTRQYIPIVWRFRKNKDLVEIPFPIFGFNVYIFCRGVKNEEKS